MQEDILIRQMQQQSEQALREIIRSYSAYVSTIIRNVGRGAFSESDVEELAADQIMLWVKKYAYFCEVNIM